MPKIADDRRALDILAEDPTNSAAPQIMGKLGVNQDDVRAFQISNKLEAENPDDPRIPQLRNKVFKKVAETNPSEDMGFFTTGGAGGFDRFVAKNIIDQNPQVQETYFKRKGFQTRFIDGNLEVRKETDVNFKPVDPEGIDAFDAFDVVGDIIEGAVATLAETGGAIVGGLTGAPLGPVGIGAGIGVGKALGGGVTTALFETGRQLASKAFGAREEIEGQPILQAGAIGALLPAALRGGGTVLKGTSKVISKGLSKFQGGLKKTAPEIEAAARELGAKATPGQLFDSRIVQELESAQAQSGGMIGGISTRKQIEQNKQAVQEVADALVSEASSKSKFELGDEVGQMLSEDLATKLAPAEAIYSGLENQFKRKAFTPNVSPLKAKIEQLQKEFKFDKEAMGALSDVEKSIFKVEKNIDTGEDEIISQIKNLDDLKKFKTSIGRIIGSDSGNFSKRDALSPLYGAATETRSKTLLDLAEKADLEKGGKGEFFKKAKADIELADQIYKESIGEISNVILKPGEKLKGGPKRALQKFLEKTPEIERIKKILNTNDPKKIAKVKADFPEAFEKLRGSRIAEIAESSSVGGEVNPLKLSKKINALPPESIKLLFGENAEKKAKALQIFLQNVPKPTGPSGTPRGFEVFRFRAILDNLQSLRRDFTLNLRTKAPLEQDIFSRLSKVFSSPVTTGGAIAGAGASNFNQPSPLNNLTFKPQLGGNNTPQLGGR